MPDPNQQALTEARINIARLETEVSYLSAGMADVKASQAEMAEKLDILLRQIAEAKGGWKTLMLVGGMASTFGAGLTWLAAHLPKVFA